MAPTSSPPSNPPPEASIGAVPLHSGARRKAQNDVHSPSSPASARGAGDGGANRAGALVRGDAAGPAPVDAPRPNARGETMYQLGTSPGQIEGIDISHALTLVGQREGFQDFPMHIGTHLWPVNQGKDAQYQRAFKMVETECNRWMAEDSLYGDVTFYGYMHCEGYTRGVAKKNEAGRSAKPCRCEPEVVETQDKKNKKAKR